MFTNIKTIINDDNKILPFFQKKYIAFILKLNVLYDVMLESFKYLVPNRIKLSLNFAIFIYPSQVVKISRFTSKRLFSMRNRT